MNRRTVAFTMPPGNGGIIRKICKDIDIANVDYVRLFVKYLLKYSVGFITKKERNNREPHKAFPHIKEWCDKSHSITTPFPWFGGLWVGSCGEIHTKSGSSECENAIALALYLSAGVW